MLIAAKNLHDQTSYETVRHQALAGSVLVLGLCQKEMRQAVHLVISYCELWRQLTQIEHITKGRFFDLSNKIGFKVQQQHVWPPVQAPRYCRAGWRYTQVTCIGPAPQCAPILERFLEQSWTVEVEDDDVVPYRREFD